MSDHITEGFEILQDCVRAGRKLKDAAQVSFKERPFLVRFKIPFAIAFAMNREDNQDVIRRMLKAHNVYLEEDGFDGPFEASDLALEFPNLSGSIQIKEVRAQLWTAEPIWN